jgi:hypothetical protein
MGTMPHAPAIAGALLEGFVNGKANCGFTSCAAALDKQQAVMPEEHLAEREHARTGAADAAAAAGARSGNRPAELAAGAADPPVPAVAQPAELEGPQQPHHPPRLSLAGNGKDHSALFHDAGSALERASSQASFHSARSAEPDQAVEDGAFHDAAAAPQLERFYSAKEQVALQMEDGNADGAAPLKGPPTLVRCPARMLLCLLPASVTWLTVSQKMFARRVCQEICMLSCLQDLHAVLLANKADSGGYCSL